MSTAPDRTSDPRPPGQPGLHLLFPGDDHSVRTALATAMAAMQLSDEAHSAVEIVLAEVFNNVVEHAYADGGTGLIEIEVEPVPDGLAFRICDNGRPMPLGVMPAGQAQDLSGEPQDLPEGGFGWFLIRELTEELCYHRVEGHNELSFRMCLDPFARKP